MIVDTISRLSSIRPKAVHGVKPKDFLQNWLWRFRVQKYKEELKAWFDEVEEIVASLSNPTASDSWKTSEKKSYPVGETKNPGDSEQSFRRSPVCFSLTARRISSQLS
jgi:hypothetical protein